MEDMEKEPAITVTLNVRGMDCPDCAARIENAVSKIAGVKSISVNFLTTQARLELSNPRIVPTIEKRITSLGYSVTKESERAKGPIFWAQRGKVIITVTSGLLASAAFVLALTGYPQSITTPLYLMAIVIGGFSIAFKGFAAARKLNFDMNFLMTIAVIGAAAIGDWLEGATVVFLFTLAQLLESFTMEKVRNAIRSLMTLSPHEAVVQKNGQEVRLPVEEIAIGDMILVKPGEKIALDGIVIEGISTVNQAPITGESLPVEKEIGSEVFAGTINGQGALCIRVTRLSKDTTLARIIHLVQEAQARKAPSQLFVEQFARYYTPLVMFLAVLIASLPPLFFGLPFDASFYRALVLLVIACPCALVISTPVSVISGLTRAAQAGILMKGGVYLEQVGTINVIAFDKTGTLTHGKPRVIDILSCNSRSENELLTIAATLELRSEHPIAAAIIKESKERSLAIEQVRNLQAITGKGAWGEINGAPYYIGNHRLFDEQGWCSHEIDEKLDLLESEGKTVVLIGNGREGVMGIIAIADEVREGTKNSLQRLQEAGVEKLVMLTGDNSETAKAIAKKLNIDDYRAALLPEDKVQTIRTLLSSYGNVAMVGDGVNDAPALAAATIGVAMGGTGTDTALETADILLITDDLSKLAFTVKLSRKTLAIIKENITLALTIKGVFLALAIFGFSTLWMAIAADMGASLLVTFNGLRLLSWEE
ncbi:MAG: cadmium-translocating P-type ATPase, partial [Candidatus Tectomicrobia bacterium]|nr:cadmium-translocating P-type ATPase [Candidatus Tectomicrobia bacterium]